MKLSKFKEFKWKDLLIPFHDPKCWPDSRRDHILAHVVGGGLCYLLGAAVSSHPILVVFTLSLGWQLFLEEMYSTLHAYFPQVSEFPLWSMIWDTAVPTLTALLLFLFFGLH